MKTEGENVIIHIGRKAPKGFKELSGSVHLGRGIWALKIERIVEKKQEKSKTKREG